MKNWGRETREPSRLPAQSRHKEAGTDRPNLLRHRLPGTQVISTWFPVYSISLRVSLSPKGPEGRDARDRPWECQVSTL